jgi:hypothetical protein
MRIRTTSGSKTAKVTRKKDPKHKQAEKTGQKIRTGLKAGPEGQWP